MKVLSRKNHIYTHLKKNAYNPLAPNFYIENLAFYRWSYELPKPYRPEPCWRDFVSENSNGLQQSFWQWKGTLST